MENQILIRGFRSVKSSSRIYRILAAAPCVCPEVPGDKAPWSVGVSEIQDKWPAEQLKGADPGRSDSTIVMA